MSTEVKDVPVYEVFAQTEALSFATYVGSVRASSPKDALEIARECYFRRDAAFDIWVVPQDQILHARSFPETLPGPHEDKGYRLTSGYDNSHMWKQMKALHPSETTKLTAKR